MVEADNDSATIRVDDGGIAVIRHNGEQFVSDYYQSRDKNEIPDWEKLSKGKMYCKEWSSSYSNICKAMIDHALNWLVLSTGIINVVKIEKENFKFK